MGTSRKLKSQQTLHQSQDLPDGPDVIVMSLAGYPLNGVPSP
jgi:hypothetical protein